MRCLSRANLESIAARVNHAYWRLPEAAAFPHRVDPTVLLTVLLRLKLDARRLSRDGLTLGLTSFSEVDIEVFDQEELYPLDGKTVLVEKELMAEGASVGRLNFTIAHEGSHHILNMLFPDEHSHETSARKVLRYRMSGQNCCGTRNWEEWQMDTLASALLMPPDLLRRNMAMVGLGNRLDYLNRVWREKEYEKFTELSDVMGVSKEALTYRMQRLRLLGEDQIRNPNKLIDIWRDDDYE